MKHQTKIFPLGQRRAGYAAASLVAGLVGVSAMPLTGVALAKSPATLGIAKSVPVKSNSESVVVNLHGITVYTLSGESSHHLECTKANTCFKFWFPVTVSSARTKLTVASGIKGKLGKLHRDGIYQVTLGGRPLYTFIGDGTKKRSAIGEGIVSFGGTWHVIAVGPVRSKTTTMPAPTVPTTTSSTTTPSNPYP